MRNYSRWLKGGILLAVTCLVSVVVAQSQSVSIAIPSFQDDTGANAPVELGQSLAQSLQQKIATGYNDVLPRLVGGVDSAVVKNMSLDQLAALAKQSGARFVIRGGVLAFISNPSGSGNNVTVQLYADIISADSATVITTVRAEGSGTQTGAAQLSAIDVKSDQFASSGPGQAFAAAIAQLGDSIHQALITVQPSVPATVNVQTTTTSDNSQTAIQIDASKTADLDADLQQLIAQAGTLLSNSTDPSDPNMIAAGQALQALKAALETKANLMQTGKDTSQADQDIATQRQALQNALAQLTNQVAATSATGTVTTNFQQSADQKKSFLQSLDDLAAQTLTLLQNIQQMRTAAQSLTESSPNPSFGQNGNVNGVPAPLPAEQQLGECNGIVTDQNGAAVSNAQVADQTSGAFTSTDNNGLFDLKGLLINQIAVINVTANGKTQTAQTPITAGQIATLDFQFNPDQNGGIRRPIILPPVVILHPPIGSKVGAVNGIVRDPQGRPLARTLVALKGFGFARTDSQGRFRFLNVPSGAQQLSINQSGLTPKSIQLQIDPAKNTIAQLQFAATDRIASPPKAQLFQTSSGVTVTGTVINRQNVPLSGTKISLVQGTSAIAVFTGQNGAFVLNNVRPGQYRVIASKAGYDPSLQNVTLSPGGKPTVQFRLNQQSSPAVANLLNERAMSRVSDTGLKSTKQNPQPTPKIDMSGKLAGQIVDAKTGRPIAGAIVTISNQQRTQTNISGDFAFAGLLPGKYQLAISKAGYTVIQGTVSIQAGKTTQASLTLQPKPPVSFRGRRP